MTLPVYLHDRAERALDANYLWWAEHRSQEQAAQWFNSFIDALESLGENPERYSLASESPLFPHEVRQLNFGTGATPTHRALFTIRPDKIYVLSIRPLSQRPVTPDDLDG